MVLPPRPDDPLELLDAPPEGEYALLEFALEWDNLVGSEAQLAAALRPARLAGRPRRRVGDLKR